MSYSKIDELSGACYRAVQNAGGLIERDSVRFRRERIYRSKNPVIGTHTGPDVLFLAVVVGNGKTIDIQKVI